MPPNPKDLQKGLQKQLSKSERIGQFDQHGHHHKIHRKEIVNIFGHSPLKYKRNDSRQKSNFLP